MTARRIPNGVKLGALAVALAQAAAVLWLASGEMQGSQRNLIPQILIGGAIALVALWAYAVRYFDLPLATKQPAAGLMILIVVTMALAGLHLFRIRALLGMPYDLAGWSEPMFVLDVIKMANGEAFYSAPGDSNSNTYTFAAPAVSYMIAWVAGQSQSIVFYRWLQQIYLALAAAFIAAAAWNLVKIAAPERRISRLWLVFFVPTAFLMAVNPRTGHFNLYLHNDPFAMMVTGMAVWVLTKHIATPRKVWLVAMIALPTVGFFAKQFLVIFGAMYFLHLLLSAADAKAGLRRALRYAAMAGGVGVVSLMVCRFWWGDTFRYWVFEVMGTTVVSFDRLLGRFLDAAPALLPGVVGAWILIHKGGPQRFLGICVGWLAMVAGGLYTSGITFYPSHLGPATLFGAGLFLAGLPLLWPDEPDAEPARQGFGVLAGALVTVMLFAVLGLLKMPVLNVTADLDRYVRDVQQEFQGLPTEQVLLDFGEWPYLSRGMVMKDRAAILLTHRRHFEDLNDRLRSRQYSRLLLHRGSQQKFHYAVTFNRDFEQVLLANYREVRRIPGVAGMAHWNYYDMTLGEIHVFEPLPNEIAEKKPGN